MKKPKLVQILKILGIAACLFVGAQIAVALEGHSDAPGGVSAARIAYADADTAPTPSVPPADPNGVPGLPGAPSDNTIPGPEGQDAVGPSALSDTDIAFTPSTGVPAITPSISDAGPASPAFTVSDVVNYENSQYCPSCLGGQNGAAGYSSSTTTSMVSAEFITYKDLLLRDDTLTLNLPDDTLLCFVQYSGSFQQGNPTGATTTFPYAMEVYDAHTGNLLVWGTNTSLK